MAGRRSRSAREQPRAQHFLGSGALAAEIVSAAGLTRADTVFEFGAGYGRLTGELVRVAGRVYAVELDPRLAARLRRRFGAHANVSVVCADLLDVRLPPQRFRVVSNPPFHLTAALLHRLLDDPRTGLQRADLVLEWGAALALTGVFGPAHKARRWLPRWEFLLLRRIGRAEFDPPPGADAALVSIRRRS